MNARGSEVDLGVWVSVEECSQGIAMQLAPKRSGPETRERERERVRRRHTVHSLPLPSTNIHLCSHALVMRVCVHVSCA